MSHLAHAIAIAAQAHEGQRDKAEAIYILHPLRVMLSLDTDEERTVAVLHDLLEDADGWDAARLREHGFSEAVIAALDCLTKREGEDYDALIARASTNPIARKVKLADLRDNMDTTRLEALGPKDLERLAKYHRSYRRLLEEPATAR